jgi:hypothetical protein
MAFSELVAKEVERTGAWKSFISLYDRQNVAVIEDAIDRVYCKNSRPVTVVAHGSSVRGNGHYRDIDMMMVGTNMGDKLLGELFRRLEQNFYIQSTGIISVRLKNLWMYAMQPLGTGKKIDLSIPFYRARGLTRMDLIDDFRAHGRSYVVLFLEGQRIPLAGV